MIKKVLSMVSALCLAVAFTACGTQSNSSSSVSQAVSSVTQSSESQSQQSTSQPEQQEEITFRIAGMKGPTTMGMVKLMEEAEQGESSQDYQVEMYATAQEILPLMIQGEVDIALLPANVASNLYNQTKGQVQVAAINTLGVLYLVENGDSINSIADLKGKTIYSTGKNNTPEYTLNYILQQNDIDPASDVTVEYKSEAAEVATLLSQQEGIAVLPQPYVTIASSQNENLRTVLDLTEEWDKVSPDSSLVTGVLVVNKEFAGNNTAQFEQFLQDYKASIDFVNQNTTEAAQLVANYGIVPKAPIAEKALPECNIVYIDKNDMKTKLSGYLQVLMEQNAQSIGGAMPQDDFYYGAE